VFAVGKKAREYCTRRGYDVLGSVSLKDIFSSSDLQELYDVIDSARASGSYSAMTVWYNYFKNTMKQIPV
jgi:F0F1-type ATP synthase gamma subunit